MSTDKENKTPKTYPQNPVYNHPNMKQWDDPTLTWEELTEYERNATTTISEVLELDGIETGDRMDEARGLRRGLQAGLFTPEYENPLLPKAKEIFGKQS